MYEKKGMKGLINEGLNLRGMSDKRFPYWDTYTGVYCFELERMIDIWCDREILSSIEYFRRDERLNPEKHNLFPGYFIPDIGKGIQEEGNACVTLNFRHEQKQFTNTVIQLDILVEGAHVYNRRRPATDSFWSKTLHYYNIENYKDYDYIYRSGIDLYGFKKKEINENEYNSLKTKLKDIKVWRKDKGLSEQVYNFN